MKWTEEATSQLGVTPFAVHSVFCAHSNVFHILIYAQAYKFGLFTKM